VLGRKWVRCHIQEKGGGVGGGGGGGWGAEKRLSKRGSRVRRGKFFIFRGRGQYGAIVCPVRTVWPTGIVSFQSPLVGAVDQGRKNNAVAQWERTW